MFLDFVKCDAKMDANCYNFSDKQDILFHHVHTSNSGNNSIDGVGSIDGTGSRAGGGS